MRQTRLLGLEMVMAEIRIMLIPEITGIQASTTIGIRATIIITIRETTTIRTQEIPMIGVGISRMPGITGIQISLTLGITETRITKLPGMQDLAGIRGTSIGMQDPIDLGTIGLTPSLSGRQAQHLGLTIQDQIGQMISGGMHKDPMCLLKYLGALTMTVW